MTRQPARYRRVVEEFVDSIVRSVEYQYTIVHENHIGDILDEYCIEYASHFVHSREGYKAENQWHDVWLVAMLRLADDLMSMHAKKLELIVNELMNMFTTYEGDWYRMFLLVNGRYPYTSEVVIYRNFMHLVIRNATYGDIAELIRTATHSRRVPSEATVRTYVRNVVRAINQLISMYYHGYTHLRHIMGKALETGMLRAVAVPTYIFGRRWHMEMNMTRIYTIWHLLACRCRPTMVGYTCDEYCGDICFEYWYIPVAYSLIQCCYEDRCSRSWELLDICSASIIHRVGRQYNGTIPVPYTRAGLYVTFIDYDRYATFTEPRNRTCNRFRLLVRGLWTEAKMVLRQLYNMEMEHKCMEVI